MSSGCWHQRRCRGWGVGEGTEEEVVPGLGIPGSRKDVSPEVGLQGSGDGERQGGEELERENQEAWPRHAGAQGLVSP